MDQARTRIDTNLAVVNNIATQPVGYTPTPTNTTTMQGPVPGPAQNKQTTTVVSQPPSSGVLSSPTTNNNNTQINTSPGYPVKAVQINGKTVLYDKNGNEVTKYSQPVLRFFQAQAKKNQQLAQFNWDDKKFIYDVGNEIKNIDNDQYKNLKMIQQMNPQSFNQFNKLKNMTSADRIKFKNRDNQNDWYQTFAEKGANRDQLLNQMVVASYNNDRKNNANPLSKQVLYQYSKQRPSQYLIGQFASFARQKQQQIMQKQKLIKWIIRQAVISFQKKLKQNYQALKQISNSSTSEEQLLLYFNNMEDVKKFIDNQVQFTTQQVKQAQFFSIYKILKIFIARKKLIRKTAFVDGKFLKLAQLKISERFYHQKIIYIPTMSDSIYIRLAPKQTPVKVLFRQNQFFSQKQLQVLDQAAKNQIIQMVMLYLRQKKIILSKIEAQSIQKKIINQMNNVKK